MPALQPPEVNIDPTMKAQFEKELAEAQSAELPDDGDDGDY